jgi:L-serine dehydratase
MAAQVHPLSAKHIVPEVIKYMEPFFKKKAEVEELIDEEIQVFEKSRMENTLEEANKIAKGLAKEARSIVDPFGEPVVGGSSQAVGSPTNAGRIVHELASGQIKKIKVELYPELFARRGINIPGILMGAVFGASTADGDSYKEVLAKVKEKEIEIQIDEIDISQLQRITMETTEGKFMIDSLNRGGARLVIRDALPSLEAAEEAADKLGIDVVS